MIQLLIALVVVGAVLYLLQRVTFIDEQMKLVIRVLLVVFIVIWAIKILVPMSGLG